MARFDSSGNSALDKEVTIRIRPRSVLKGGITILVLVLVFFLGRWSVDPSSLGSATVESAAVAEVEEVAEPEPAEAEEEDTESFSLTGFLSGLFGSSEEEEEVTAAVVAGTVESNITNATTGETAAENLTNATAAEPEEPLITTYVKVAVAINDIDFDWKGTWGKITKVDYTVKNTEAGTIKPDHLGMLVEGYDDFEKKIPLPISSKTVKAGQTASSKVQVPQGFSYSEVTAGDLTEVVITFTLYDADNKVMASFKTAYNLKG